MGRVRAPDRVLDANLNRAREGLRVLEDLARFALDDGPLASRLRDMRHALDHAARSLLIELLSARDSARDVGRRERGAGDTRDLDGVASSNLRRLQEALRVMEEVSRGRHAALARLANRLRYETYDLERGVVPRLWRRSRVEAVRLYALFDPCVTPFSKVRTAVRGGVGMIQLRCKDASTRELLRHLRSLKKFEVPVIINDRVDLAAEADGVHLGLEDLPITRARRALGEKAIIGATTHSLREARGAVASGADYISVGPLYPTPLKPDLPARGFTYLRAARTLGVPVFCIGGICEENIREAVRRGCDRVAVSRGVLESPDPCRSARLLRRALADG